MNYAVDWEPGALNDLAAVWMATAGRQAVTAAQTRIDGLLATDPLGYGTPVAEGLYAIEVQPLRALFEVDHGRRLVKVVSVRELS